MKRPIAIALALVALEGCDGHLLSPTPREITVMTRNLYLGAALDPILSAAPEQLPTAVAQAFAQVQATNFAERAERLADEIAATRPDLVGLQEVALYRRQSPGDAIVGGQTPATTPVIDFQQLLLAALSARGLTYAPVAARIGLDLEVPMSTGSGPTGPTFDDIRFTDRDVILARGDVPTASPTAADYAAKAAVSIGGATILISRGWVSVVTRVAGSDVRVVDTHLEVQGAAPIQEAQARELVDLLSTETRPIILMGDLNSAANVFQTLSYTLLIDAGFVDAWAQGQSQDPGFTCCQAPDLLNAASALDERLDFVLWHNGLSVETRWAQVGVSTVGDKQDDRTPSGLWPSDHAGVVATLTVLPRAGLGLTAN